MPAYDFVNPYNFVRLQQMDSEARQTPVLHNAWQPGLYSGKLVCLLFPLSPLFIPYSAGVLEIPLPRFRHRDGSVRGRSKDASVLKAALEFFHHGDHTPVIPASSLKGAFRSIAEAAVNGCLSMMEPSYGPTKRGNQRHAPRNYLDDDVKGMHLQPCATLEHGPGDPDSGLCPTCRLFGMPAVDEGSPAAGTRPNAFAGKLRFSSAVLDNFNLQALARDLDSPLGSGSVYGPAVLLTELSTPDPTSYLYRDDTGALRGRKFYYHRSEIYRDTQWETRAMGFLRSFREDRSHPDLRRDVEGDDGLGRKIVVRPLQPFGLAKNLKDAPRFLFTVEFHNLTDEELDLLLYSLRMEQARDTSGFRRGVYPKLGYGKPAGLGSAAVGIVSVEWWDEAQRYAGGPASEQPDLRGLQARREAFLESHWKEPNLQDLRAILTWPSPGLEIRYPRLNQFKTTQNPDGYLLPPASKEPGRK